MASPNQPVNKLGNTNNPLASGIVFPITPADGTDLTDATLGTVIIRGLIVNVGGTVAYQDSTGIARTVTLPSGCFPVVMKRILSTGTTATGLSGII
jgi:hypothetical protein